MIRSGGELIMVLARINNLFIQQLVPLNVGPIAIRVNGCCKTTSKHDQKHTISARFARQSEG
jgi:hypothetical protein